MAYFPKTMDLQSLGYNNLASNSGHGFYINSDMQQPPHDYFVRQTPYQPPPPHPPPLPQHHRHLLQQQQQHNTQEAQYNPSTNLVYMEPSNAGYYNQAPVMNTTYQHKHKYDITNGVHQLPTSYDFNPNHDNTAQDMRNGIHTHHQQYYTLNSPYYDDYYTPQQQQHGIPNTQTNTDPVFNAKGEIHEQTLLNVIPSIANRENVHGQEFNNLAQHLTVQPSQTPMYIAYQNAAIPSSGGFILCNNIQTESESASHQESASHALCNPVYNLNFLNESLSGHRDTRAPTPLLPYYIISPDGSISTINADSVNALQQHITATQAAIPHTNYPLASSRRQEPTTIPEPAPSSIQTFVQCENAHRPTTKAPTSLPIAQEPNEQVVIENYIARENNGLVQGHPPSEKSPEIIRIYPMVSGSITTNQSNQPLPKSVSMSSPDQATDTTCLKKAGGSPSTITIDKSPNEYFLPSHNPPPSGSFIQPAPLPSPKVLDVHSINAIQTTTIQQNGCIGDEGLNEHVPSSHNLSPTGPFIQPAPPPPPLPPPKLPDQATPIQQDGRIDDILLNEYFITSHNPSPKGSFIQPARLPPTQLPPAPVSLPPLPLAPLPQAQLRPAPLSLPPLPLAPRPPAQLPPAPLSLPPLPLPPPKALDPQSRTFPQATPATNIQQDGRVKTMTTHEALSRLQRSISLDNPQSVPRSCSVDDNQEHAQRRRPFSYDGTLTSQGDRRISFDERSISQEGRFFARSGALISHDKRSISVDSRPIYLDERQNPSALGTSNTTSLQNIFAQMQRKESKRPNSYDGSMPRKFSLPENKSQAFWNNTNHNDNNSQRPVSIHDIFQRPSSFQDNDSHIARTQRSNSFHSVKDARKENDPLLAYRAIQKKLLESNDDTKKEIIRQIIRKASHGVVRENTGTYASLPPFVLNDSPNMSSQFKVVKDKSSIPNDLFLPTSSSSSSSAHVKNSNNQRQTSSHSSNALMEMLNFQPKSQTTMYYAPSNSTSQDCIYASRSKEPRPILSREEWWRSLPMDQLNHTPGQHGPNLKTSSPVIVNDFDTSSQSLKLNLSTRDDSVYRHYRPWWQHSEESHNSGSGGKKMNKSVPQSVESIKRYIEEQCGIPDRKDKKKTNHLVDNIISKSTTNRPEKNGCGNNNDDKNRFKSRKLDFSGETVFARKEAKQRTGEHATKVSTKNKTNDNINDNKKQREKFHPKDERRSTSSAKSDDTSGKAALPGGVTQYGFLHHHRREHDDNCCSRNSRHHARQNGRFHRMRRGNGVAPKIPLEEKLLSFTLALKNSTSKDNCIQTIENTLTSCHLGLKSEYQVEVFQPKGNKPTFFGSLRLGGAFLGRASGLSKKTLKHKVYEMALDALTSKSVEEILALGGGKGDDGKKMDPAVGETSSLDQSGTDFRGKLRLLQDWIRTNQKKNVNVILQLQAAFAESQCNLAYCFNKTPVYDARGVRLFIKCELIAEGQIMASAIAIGWREAKAKVAEKITSDFLTLDVDVIHENILKNEERDIEDEIREARESNAEKKRVDPAMLLDLFITKLRNHYSRHKDADDTESVSGGNDESNQEAAGTGESSHTATTLAVTDPEMKTSAGDLEEETKTKRKGGDAGERDGSCRQRAIVVSENGLGDAGAGAESVKENNIGGSGSSNDKHVDEIIQHSNLKSGRESVSDEINGIVDDFVNVNVNITRQSVKTDDGLSDVSSVPLPSDDDSITVAAEVDGVDGDCGSRSRGDGVDEDCGGGRGEAVDVECGGSRGDGVDEDCGGGRGEAVDVECGGSRGDGVDEDCGGGRGEAVDAVFDNRCKDVDEDGGERGDDVDEDGGGRGNGVDVGNDKGNVNSPRVDNMKEADRENDDAYDENIVADDADNDDDGDGEAEDDVDGDVVNDGDNEDNVSFDDNDEEQSTTLQQHQSDVLLISKLCIQLRIKLTIVFKKTTKDVGMNNPAPQVICQVYVAERLLSTEARPTRREAQDGAFRVVRQTLIGAQSGRDVMKAFPSLTPRDLKGEDIIDVVHKGYTKIAESNRCRLHRFKTRRPGLDKKTRDVTDLIILEHEDWSTDRVTHAHCILNQSASMSGLLLEWTCEEDYGVWRCEITLQGKDMSRCVARTKRDALTMASVKALFSMYETQPIVKGYHAKSYSTSWVTRDELHNKVKVPVQTETVINMEGTQATSPDTRHGRELSSEVEKAIERLVSEFFHQPTLRELVAAPDWTSNERKCLRHVSKVNDLRCVTEDKGQGDILVLAMRLDLAQFVDILKSQPNQSQGRYRLLPDSERPSFNDVAGEIAVNDSFVGGIRSHPVKSWLSNSSTSSNSKTGKSRNKKNTRTRRNHQTRRERLLSGGKMEDWGEKSSQYVTANNSLAVDNDSDDVEFISNKFVDIALSADDNNNSTCYYNREEGEEEERGGVRREMNNSNKACNEEGGDNSIITKEDVDGNDKKTGNNCMHAVIPALRRFLRPLGSSTPEGRKNKGSNDKGKRRAQSEGSAPFVEIV